MECPNCKTPLTVSTKFPDKQVLSFSIKYENDLLEAKMLHRVLAAAEKLLVEVGRDLGQTVNVFIVSIEKGERELTFSLLVVEKKKQPKP